MSPALAAVLVAGCAGVDAPQLDRVIPAIGRRGDAVVVMGHGFCVPDCDGSPAGTVDFGVELPQVRAVVVGWDETAIQAIVPQTVDVGSTEILVTVNDRSSNPLAFEVLP